MFDEKYISSEQERLLLEYIQELDAYVEMAIIEEAFEAAFQPALELRHIVNTYFPARHVYRAMASFRVGFLYYSIGLGKESKQELRRALRILDNYPDEFSVLRYYIRHIYYHAVGLTGNKDEIIKASESLLSDPNINAILEIRIYLNLAKQYAFGKGKHLSLMYEYLNKAKYLLTIYNLTDTIDYRESLYLSAIYAMEVEDPHTALKLSEHLQSMIDEDAESDDRLSQLYRRVTRLIAMIEHQLDENTKPNDQPMIVN